MRIAFYGKGGIGKSTVSSNLSACFAVAGKKVLQIGCDPKHDSTILISNEPYDTVLELACKDTDLEINDIIHHGKYGIDCVEIGGPTPGVGCAGRGIIRGIETIERIGVLEREYDIIIYDILGDVVCGGFFEPLKGNKVDEMYIVTSGEFNSLFAANNICAGFINCDINSRGIKLGGIIGNLRGIRNEEKIIREFCRKINVNLIELIPRDNKIEESTFVGTPMIEKFPEEKVTELYKNLAKKILCKKENLQSPKPLALSELRELVYKLKNY